MTHIRNLLENADYNGFSLEHLMNEENEDEEPKLLKNSRYYDNDKFISTLQRKNSSFNIISLNCQSLNAKFNQLKIYLELLKQNNILISAIILQETWISDQDDVSLLQLEDYNFISKGKSCSAHGGVAIYLHKQFSYSIMSHQESSSWDGIFIKVIIESLSANNTSHKSLVLGSLYRPPRQNVGHINTFIEEFTELANLLRNFKFVIIGGGFQY